MSGYNLKSEEDVKEYLKNLFTEYQFGCYGEKNPEVCHLLGDYYEAIKKNFKEAAVIYQKNCDNLDYGRSCAKFGNWKLIGKGCKKDVLAGFSYLKKSCDLNDEIGCTNGGIVAIGNSLNEETGESLKNRKEVAERGVEMLDKACIVKKSERACFFLAGMFAKGIPNLVAKNATNSYKYSLNACELGSPGGCMIVSRMHENGEDGIEKNAKLAETFKLRGKELEKQIRDYQSPVEFGQGIKP